MCLAIPARVVRISDAGRNLAVVDSGGVQREVDLSCVLGEGGVAALLDAWVLVHVGVALAVISAEEAAASLALWAELQDGEPGERA